MQNPRNKVTIIFLWKAKVMCNSDETEYHPFLRVD